MEAKAPAEPETLENWYIEDLPLDKQAYSAAVLAAREKIMRKEGVTFP